MLIVPVDDANHDAACQLLSHAFRDDPMIRWLMGENRRRDDALFRFVGDYHRAPTSSDFYVDEAGRPLGAAIWDPPGYRPTLNRWKDTTKALSVFRTRIRRGAIVEELFPTLRPKEPHWYLSTIGAIEQGRGIGSALLEHRLSQISGAAYLESSNRTNIPLYERYGFTVVDEVVLPLNGPAIWPMYRAA